MQHYFAAITLVLMVAIVFTRAAIMKRKGIEVMQFGKMDPKDFLLPPFALLYFYLVFAAAFNFPSPSRQEFFKSGLIAWVGVAFCALGLLGLFWSILSFGRSFRVGIDTETPDKLITTGIFAYSRNPIYTAFAVILLGQFLIFPNWILLLFTAAAVWLFNRQILLEEEYLKGHYGEEYAEYCRRVRRYI